MLVLEPQDPNEGYRLLCSATSSRLRKSRRKSRKGNFLMLLVRATGCGLGGDVICRPSNKQAAASSTRRHESGSAVYLGLQVTLLPFACGSTILGLFVLVFWRMCLYSLRGDIFRQRACLSLPKSRRDEPQRHYLGQYQTFIVSRQRVGYCRALYCFYPTPRSSCFCGSLDRSSFASECHTNLVPCCFIVDLYPSGLVRFEKTTTDSVDAVDDFAC
jgi:hypothetical protein